MSLTLTITDVDHTQNRIRRIASIAFSGNYSTGGDTLNLTAAGNPNNLAAAQFGRNPIQGGVLNAPDGYALELIPNPNPSAWALKVTTAAGAELAAGAYPAALTGDANAALEFISKTNL